MINIAVVGCGYWGPNLIRNFNEIDGSNMYMCCDLDQKKLDSMKKRFPGMKITKDYNEVLKDKNVDAVSIATPPATHFRLAKEALMADKHVIVEKPLTLKSGDAQELIKIAKERKKILMVGHTFEYVPAVNKLKELIKSGELGEIYYIYTHRLNLGLWQPDCNVIWDLAPHDISTILYLLEQMPVSVCAKGAWHVDKDKEDVAFITLTFPNKRICHLHVSWLDPLKVRKTVVVGSKKMVVFDDVEQIEKLKIYDKSVSKHDSYTSFGEFQMSYNYGDAHIPKVSSTEPLKIECSHFLECIRDNKKPRSDGESGLRVVKVLEAAEESIKNNGKEVVLK